MSSHPDTRALIEFLFKVDDEAARVRVESHLAECPVCRAEAERLRSRLGQLDVLRGEAGSTETLVADTLRAVRLGRRAPRARAWSWAPWAALVPLLLLAVLLPRALREQTRELSSSEQRIAAPAPAPASSVAETLSKDKKAEAENRPRRARADSAEREAVPSQQTVPIDGIDADRVANTEQGQLGFEDFRAEKSAVGGAAPAEGYMAPAAPTLKAVAAAIPKTVSFALPMRDGVYTSDELRIEIQRTNDLVAVTASNASAHPVALVIESREEHQRTGARPVLVEPASSTNLLLARPPIELR